MPRRLQVEFSGEVQAHTDSHGGEMSATHIWQLFSRTYLESVAPVRYVEHHLVELPDSQGIRLAIEVGGVPCLLRGEGNGPIDAAVHALQSAGINVQVRSFEERSIRPSCEAGDAQACAFLELTPAGGGVARYGVALDTNIVTASIMALISGINRLGISEAELTIGQRAA